MKWTKNTIIKAFEDYYEKYKNIPSSKELNIIVGLPKRNTIKNVFGLTYKEFRNGYFPENIYFYNTKFNDKNNDYYIQDFKKRYVELGMPTQKEYESNRNIGAPQSKYIMKLLGVKTWSELLDKCGFNNTGEIKVKVICDFRNIEKIEEIFSKIHKIIEEE